jgi:hypothetical protein
MTALDDISNMRHQHVKLSRECATSGHLVPRQDDMNRWKMHADACGERHSCGQHVGCYTRTKRLTLLSLVSESSMLSVLLAWERAENKELISCAYR